MAVLEQDSAPLKESARRLRRDRDDTGETVEKLPQLRTRAPWAFILALLLIVGVEVVWRITGPPGPIPYDLGEREYHSLAAHLAAHEPAEVVIIGSSRGRESVVVPELRQAAEQALGRPVTVANYSLSGGRADQHEAVLRRLLRNRKNPALILVGLAERDLRQNEAHYDLLGLFWRLPDWLRAFRQGGVKTLEALPYVARNEFAEWSYTLRYRPQIRHTVQARLSGVPDPIPNPIEGGHTPHHASVLERLAKDPGYQERSLATRKRGRKKDQSFQDEVRKYVKGQLRKGKFPMDEPLVGSLERIADLCSKAGVPVIFFETPPSDVLRKYLPEGAYRKYLDTVRQTARKRNVPWLTLETMGLRIDDSHMRDKAHLNYKGASALTRALATHGVIPRLKDPSAPLEADRARQRSAATAPSTQPIPGGNPRSSDQ